MEEEVKANKHFLAEDMKEFAFECKGVKYYQFKDKALPITYMRLKAAQEIIAHTSELKVTEAVLDEFQDMIDVYAGVRTGDHSVFYFDESEDPAVWDRIYADKKIKQWLGEHETEAFFLRSLPLHTIISSEFLQAGSQEFLQNLLLLTSTHSTHNLSMLSDEERESEVGMNITLLGLTYEALANLNDKGLLMSTSS